MIGLGWPGGDESGLGHAGRPGRRGGPSGPRLRPSAGRRSAARAAAASAGVGAVVKMYERARLTIRSMTSRDAATKPPSEPSVFDSVPTRTTVPSVQRRRGPRLPPRLRPGRGREVGAEDGVGLIERRAGRRGGGTGRRARSTGAASPSMENTESVTTIVGALRGRRRSARSRAAPRGAPCRSGGRRESCERESRQPSMMEAWFSSSESTRTPGPPSTLSTPRLAAKPVGKQTAASVPFQSASACSSSVWTGRDPVTSREAPGAGAPAVERRVRGRHHGRVRAQAEIVVGGEGDHRRRRRAGPAGPRASNSRGARQRPSSTTASSGPGPGRPRSRSAASRVRAGASSRRSPSSQRPPPARRRSARSRPRWWSAAA